MNDDKWNWTKPDTQEPSAAEKERGGMIMLLVLGLLLTAGGLFFAWKIGVFDHNEFWGLDTPERFHKYYRETVEYSMRRGLSDLRWCVRRSAICTNCGKNNT